MTGIRIRGYIELTKPRVTWLILMSTGFGYFFGLNASGWRDCLIQIVSWRALHTLLGTGLMASGTAALNEWYERDADRKMRRTARRPLPSGIISPTGALLFGVAISAAGFGQLAHGVNLYAAMLGAATLLLYLGIYTPLKRRSWLCTTIGALPGALPPAIGFVAAHGYLNIEGVILSAILFVWQFPHFYSIAWMYRDDYGRAGIKMLPVIEPDGTSTVRQMLVYGFVLVPLSVLPTLIRMSGVAYALFALVLGAWLVRRVFGVAADRTAARARVVLLASVIYLPLLYSAMALDRHWGP
jgi:heme o synthase